MLSSRIGLVPAPRLWRASRRSSSRSGPCPPATRQAALSVSRCEARTAENGPPSGGVRARLDGVGLAGVVLAGGLVEQRHEAEIDLALAQRLERLALEIERQRGPEGIDRVGQQQHLDAARARRLELRILFQT